MTLACPKCGGTDNLRVEAFVLIRLLPNGDAEPIPQTGYLYEWNGDCDMTCGECGHNDKAEAFGEPSVAGISDEEVED